MNSLKFAAPCLFGLEGICANELKFNGFDDVKTENGRVTFSGDLNALAKANIISRYAERITLLLSEFNVYSFDDLFEGIKSIPWEQWLCKDDAFPVLGRCLGSKLHSVSDCQKIIKKAVADRLSWKYGISWFEESGAVHRIRFLIINDKLSIMLDTSGEGLHKRGYRADSNDAPIKETLAAAMVDLARVRPNHFVVDPMCGSGTILIEAAMKAFKIAPGLNRSFSAERWSQIPENIWQNQREEAKSLINRDCAFKAIGYDIDENALLIAKNNAKIAGVADGLEFIKRDINDFSFDNDYETVIVNPPYGERLLDIDAAEKLYKTMGDKFIRDKGKSYTIISPDDDFERVFGRKADKRRKLYNGMLECQVYMYFR
ncbi:MAG: class I SAM-dependent RNA methyltransferase [Ruminococcus sp.]|nr:class I SAM-dependent RNA methyltransferase [Ruminococcus sp.]